jgi:hypothetical protein
MERRFIACLFVLLIWFSCSREGSQKEESTKKPQESPPPTAISIEECDPAVVIECEKDAIEE